MLTRWFSWRAGFVINVPIGIAMMLAAPRYLAETERRSGQLEDAGAAGGLVNVTHQLGGSLGLGILITVFAAAGSATLGAQELLAHRVATSLTAGTAMLALLLIVVLIVLPRKAAQVPNSDAVSRRSPANDNLARPIGEVLTDGPPSQPKARRATTRQMVVVSMLAGGMAWMAMMSSLTVAAQTASPSWVRARAMGIYLLVFQGLLAAGSFGWGALAQRFGDPRTAVSKQWRAPDA